jgi:phosphoglycerate dehydrogenase-like enzyme
MSRGVIVTGAGLRRRLGHACVRGGSKQMRPSPDAMRLRAAVVPVATEELVDAVVRGGGVPAQPQEADAVVWTDPMDASALAETLAVSPARWVQLPVAGIESFVTAGVIDDERVWTSAKEIYGPACAEQALALMLAAARRLHVHVRTGRWMPAGMGSGHRRIKRSTVLIVGTGGIGRSLSRMLDPLGPSIVAVNRSGRPMEGAALTAPTARLPELLPRAGWVVLAAALTPQTIRLFDRAMLGHMDEEAWLVNVARGRLVDTEALVEALRSRAIGGAALDVTDPEPLPEDHPLWRMDNVIITSHTANTFEMSLPELSERVRRNVENLAAGKPLEGLVNPSLGY